MVHSPFPKKVKSEAKKAAKILHNFTFPTASTGPDKLIPAGLFLSCRGIAILTVFKAGFLVTARGGSGIVIAKLKGGEWSAPSAIGLAGLGGGFEIGAEVTDFVILLNKQSAVDAFAKGGNLTLGGNVTVAVGPLGRNLEGDVSLRSPAAIYTYSQTKGLFAGISLEGAALIERKDANRKFYGTEIRAHEILSGSVEPPDECQPLYEALQQHVKSGLDALGQMAKKEAHKKGKEAMGMARLSLMGSTRKEKGSVETPSQSSSESRRPSLQSWHANASPCPASQPRKWSFQSKSASSSPTSSPIIMSEPPSSGVSSKSGFRSSLRSSFKRTPQAQQAQVSMHNRDSFAKKTSSTSDLTTPDKWNKPLVCIAERSFTAILPCDLTFVTNDRIIILTRTDTQFDWWEGEVHGRVGIFPANFVRVIE
ncbi:SH3 domain-containing YSC84-like protein 1 [Anneissia japonica]|uniref:SH3 domain-containing YSC84-like protein 1 n=1 Tax=Anneissia japonica TaxID=1529436 RepID=UPI0014259003|nr:SH3 domain-containing YSC84-like protein 1 [Anneissia japonica]